MNLLSGNIKKANSLSLLKNLLSRPKRFATSVADLANRDSIFHDQLQKFLNFRIADPKNKEIVKNLFETGGRRAGMLSGGLGGALVNPSLPGLNPEEDSGKNRLLNILAGALGGRFAGAAAGRRLGAEAPALLQKGVGRVVTNIYAPHSYNPDFINSQILNRPGGPPSLKDVFNAIAHDKPLYSVAPEDYGREFLYRRMFNLKPRGEAADFLIPKGKGTWGYNPANPYAKKEMDSLVSAWTRDTTLPKFKMEGNVVKDPVYYKNYLEDLIANKGYSAYARTPHGFIVKPSGKFEDIWDLSLNPGEKFNTAPNVMRGMVNMFTTPEKLVGTAPKASDIVRNIPASVLQNKDVEAIIQRGLARQIAEKENISEKVITNLLSNKGKEKIYSPEIQRNLVAAQMKDKNFDAMQHIANMLSIRGTGNTFNPARQWSLGEHTVNAWGPHRLGRLTQPSGKNMYGIDLDRNVRKNMSFVSDLPKEEKQRIFNSVMSQDKDFPELYRSDPYFKSELDAEIRKAMSDAILKARTFEEPLRFSKQDIKDLYS